MSSASYLALFAFAFALARPAKRPKNAHHVTVAPAFDFLFHQNNQKKGAKTKNEERRRRRRETPTASTSSSIASFQRPIRPAIHCRRVYEAFDDRDIFTTERTLPGTPRCGLVAQAPSFTTLGTPAQPELSLPEPWTNRVIQRPETVRLGRPSPRLSR